MQDQVDYEISEDFQRIFVFIAAAKEGNGKVLVHCYQGKSRSCAVCCAYLIQHYKHSLASAMEVIRSVRPIASPNSGFMTALQRFEEQCRAAESAPKGEDGTLEI
jgi:protein-tyrosine phosphatase